MFGKVSQHAKQVQQLQQLQLQPQLQRQQYNILLFGETGSGKSTLINYLTNYFLDGSLGNLKIAIETPYLKATERWKSNEKDLNDRMKSKTSECTVYDFTKDGLHYNFIDTPRLSDTEGVEQDDRHIDKIMSFAENIGTLAAIIIVINGTVARATVNLHNTLVRLRCSVPDVLLKNLLVVLTNCSVASANFDLASLKPWIVPEDHVFYMNNSALSKPVNDWIDNAKIKRVLSNDWQESMEEIDRIIKQITELGHFDTNAFGDMLQQRQKIKSEVHGILLEVKKHQDLQSELDCAQSAQQNVATDITKKGVDLHKKITNLNTDIAAVQQALNSKEAEINKCCQELKKLCTQFNFVDELRSITNTMKANARTLTSTHARDEAESRIKRINLLADQLSSSR